MTSGDAHLAVNYEQLLAPRPRRTQGQGGRAAGRLDLADWADLQREQFLQAVAITFDAVSQHIERFAALARELAPSRSRVPSAAASLRPSRSAAPTSPTGPETFWQALQALLLHPAHPADRINGPLGVVWPDGPVPLPWYRREVELSESLPRTRAIELLQVLAQAAGGEQDPLRHPPRPPPAARPIRTSP